MTTFVRLRSKPVERKVCNGSSVTCPNPDTCCKNGDKYGCCPLTKVSNFLFCGPGLYTNQTKLKLMYLRRTLLHYDFEPLASNIFIEFIYYVHN